MASTQVIQTTQQFVQSGSYSAVDLRRMFSAAFLEGVVNGAQSLSVGNRKVGQSAGDFAVVGCASAAAMGVDVLPGEAYIKGDFDTQFNMDGLYYCRSISSLTGATRIDIATADPTNPRFDLIVLEIKDTTQDGSGLNQAQVRAITGTPAVGLQLNSTSTPDNFGTLPALPNSAIPLALVYVPAGATSVDDHRILDVRPSANGSYSKMSPTLTTYRADISSNYQILGIPTQGGAASNRPYFWNIYFGSNRVKGRVQGYEFRYVASWKVVGAAAVTASIVGPGASAGGELDGGLHATINPNLSYRANLTQGLTRFNWLATNPMHASGGWSGGSTTSQLMSEVSDTVDDAYIDPAGPANYIQGPPVFVPSSISSGIPTTGALGVKFAGSGALTLTSQGWMMQAKYVGPPTMVDVIQAGAGANFVAKGASSVVPY